MAGSGGSAGSSLVQLGSFPTEGQAKTAWTRVSKRFAYLAPLGQSIEKATVNGNTVYRLRVNAGSADQATTVSGKLKVAGERSDERRDGNGWVSTGRTWWPTYP